VYIEGSLRTEKYTDKAGVEKYSTDIIAQEMQMLGGKPEGERTERQDAPRGAKVNDYPAEAGDFRDDETIPF
jgi:single-strand DNA-binding protein